MLLLPGVEAGREPFDSEVRCVPGAEEAAAHHPLDGVQGFRREESAGAPARRAHAMRAVDLEVHRVEPHPLVLLVRHHGVLPAVEDGRVIELLEGVEEDLPVAADVAAIVEALGEVVERVVDRGDHRAEEIEERLARLLGEVHEDEPLPHLTVHRDEAVVRLVDPEELALLEDGRALPVEVVLPAVVLAGELPAVALRLHARVVGPDQLVAAVAADVVEGADHAVHAPHDD